MKILKMKLENFQGVKELEIDPQGESSAIYGDNGTGKSTVYNAFTWLMYGKPSTTEKNYTPKTTGSHNLHHSVEMTVELADGSEMVLKKDYHEVYKTIKGNPQPVLSGHTTDYSMDGVPVSETQFKKREIRMMNKSLIEWCDFTWNPVTGCQHGCLYCYAAKQANRFSGNVLINKTSEQLRKEWDERGTRWVLKKPFKNEIGKVTPFPVKFEPMFREYCLPMPAQKKKPAVIFVVSMGDLFGEWVPDEWIRRVFGAAQAAPWHTYLFLTKNPQRYIQLAEAGKLPQQGNFWYGTTVTRPDQQYAWFEPGTYNWFLSIEPIQEDFTFDASWVIRSETKGTYAPPWIIVGAETGQQKNKTIPQAEWVQHILEFSQAHGSKVFLKNNLAPYFTGELVQDFPFSYPPKNLG